MGSHLFITPKQSRAPYINVIVLLDIHVTSLVSLNMEPIALLLTPSDLFRNIY